MKNFFDDIKISLARTWERGGGVRFSDVRPQRTVYFLAYAFELMLFAARGQFLPIGASVFGIRGWTIAHAAHMLASLVFMLLWSERFKRLIYISVGIMLAGFLPFIFLPLGYTRMLFGILFYIGLGGAVTSARCGYAFAANNAERLLGMIFMFFSVAVMRFVNSRGADGVIVTYVLPLTLLAALCFCLLRFREQDFEVKSESTKSDAKGLYWALAFFIAYFAIDGYNAALVDSSFKDEYVFLLIGMVLAGIVLFLSLTRFRFSTWHIWNLFFMFSIAMGLCAAFAPQLGSQKPQYFFCGLSLMGWPLCIYTLGCAQRRFANYALLKKCTVIFLILSPVITLSSDLVEAFFPQALPVVAMLFVLAVTVALLMLSPFSYKHLFSAVWIGELRQADMALLTDKVDQVDRFAGYELTPRQKEIAALLLAAKTRRQIAGELKLSESTVKMHTAELYRRLNINSRTELFRIFGVQEEGGISPE